MSAAYTWPISLPTGVEKSTFAESASAKVLVTPMTLGPSKTRLLGRLPRPFSVSMWMTNTQIATFDDFIENTIRYTRRFNFPHPRLIGQVIEVRLVPDGDRFYDLGYRSVNLYEVTFNLQQLL